MITKSYKVQNFEHWFVPKGGRFMKQDANQVFGIRKRCYHQQALAMDLLSKDVGDRIAPISYYQEEFQVSREPCRMPLIPEGHGRCHSWPITDIEGTYTRREPLTT